MQKINKEICKSCQNCIHHCVCGFCNGGGCMAQGCPDYIDNAIINRLQAENNRLNKEIKSVIECKFESVTQTAKAEAYEECIEEAKERCSKIPAYHFNLLNVNWELDKLLKDKVSEE